jgi:hypothetical protein
MKEKSGVCSVDGCDRAVVARGWCRRHYTRWRLKGNLEARPWERQGQCTVDGCDQQSYSGGLCEMHRWRVRAHGDPGPAAPVKPHRLKERVPCAVEGCDRPNNHGSPYCHLHRERLRRTGEVGPAQPLRVRGRVKPRSDGYRRLTLPDGRRVLEHVHVMEQHLGRRLVPGENVHHKHGMRSENKIEDLELWFVMQPSGQRVTDLMEYIAEYHADAMAKILARRKAG